MKACMATNNGQIVGIYSVTSELIKKLRKGKVVVIQRMNIADILYIVKHRRFQPSIYVRIYCIYSSFAGAECGACSTADCLSCCVHMVC